jgi:hypothetical protein
MCHIAAAIRPTGSALRRASGPRCLGPDSGDVRGGSVSVVMARELFEHFKSWMSGHGHTAWIDQSFSARVAQHPDMPAAGVLKRNGIRPSRGGLSRVGHGGGGAVRRLDGSPLQGRQ